jgi:hypothetical protein
VFVLELLEFVLGDVELVHLVTDDLLWSYSFPDIYLFTFSSRIFLLFSHVYLVSMIRMGAGVTSSKYMRDLRSIDSDMISPYFSRKAEKRSLIERVM